MRGKFVASYAIAGKVAFRCFEYDPQSGRYSLDWGVLLMLLPAAGGILATIWAFFFFAATASAFAGNHSLHLAIPMVPA